MNFAVQRTIDRVIFQRNAEDRGLEPYGKLRNLGKGGHTYEKLCTHYLEADNRYNNLSPNLSPKGKGNDLNCISGWCD